MARMRLRALLIALLVLVAAAWPVAGSALEVFPADAAAQGPVSDSCTDCDGMSGLCCPPVLCTAQPALPISSFLADDTDQGATRQAPTGEHVRGHDPEIPCPPPRLP
jgi:hypothetical protein